MTDRTLAVSVHAEAVPLTTAYVTAPEPDPPEVVSVNPDPSVPEDDVTTRVVWLALSTVTETTTDTVL